MSHIDDSSRIINSEISDDVELYRFAEVKNSILSNNSVIGDFSRSINSHLLAYSKLDRFNLLYYSKLGSYSYTGANTMIFHADIEKFCSISWGVTIGGGEHNYKRISSHDFFYNNRYGLIPENCKDNHNRYNQACQLGNDVWVGANATILRGVSVGDGAIVGANSLVNKDVPPYAIVAGSPAKIIKYRFSEEIIKELLKLEWWNLPSEILKKNYELILSEDISLVIERLKKDL